MMEGEVWSTGVLECWSDGVMRKNRNRGCQKLIVWKYAIEYYVLTCDVFRSFSFEFKRVASQQIVSADSVHRNTCPVK